MAVWSKMAALSLAEVREYLTQAGVESEVVQPTISELRDGEIFAASPGERLWWDSARGAFQLQRK